MSGAEHTSLATRGWLRAGVWISLALVAALILLGGQSQLYIAPTIRWTVWLAIIVALALAGCDIYTLLRESASLPAMALRWPSSYTWTWREGSIVLLFLPFVAGIAIPPSHLDATSILAHNGVVTLMVAPAPVASLPTHAPLILNHLQLRDRLESHALSVGTSVTITGFLYRQPGLASNQILLARFMTLHCVAEAQPVAIVLQRGATATGFPKDNTWVRVTGNLQVGTAQGKATAILAPASLVIVPVPPDPYLLY